MKIQDQNRALNLNMYDRMSQLNDGNALQKSMQGTSNGIPSHVQTVNPDAVQAGVRRDHVADQNAIGGVRQQQQTPKRTGAGVPQSAPNRAKSVEQAQAQLVNRADSLSQNARQFQAFLTGGQNARANWSTMRGGSNIASQLLRANVALRFRG